MKHSLISTLVAAALWGPALAASADASAADAPSPAAADADADSSSVDSVIVTGTRTSDVKARDSAAPITVITSESLEATGATNLRDALERTLPSLNRQSVGSDLGALTDAIQLRGLSP